MEAFFNQLQQFSNTVTNEVNELKHTVSSPSTDGVSFGEYCFEKIAALSREVEQLSKSVDYPNHINFSLGHLLSLCETILDENEIMIDEVEELYKDELGELDRSVVYSNTRAIDISTSMSPPNKSKLLEFLANRDQKQVSTPSHNKKEMVQTPQPDQNTPTSEPSTDKRKKRKLEIDQETPDVVSKKPRTIKTPTLKTMGLSAASLKLIGSIEETEQTEEEGEKTSTSAPIFNQLRLAPSTVEGLLPVTEKELQTLPTYLSKQVHSLSDMNSCIEKLNQSDLKELTQESMSSMFPNLSDSSITTFLLVLLKLGKFKATRTGTANSLIYTIK